MCNKKKEKRKKTWIKDINNQRTATARSSGWSTLAVSSLRNQWMRCAGRERENEKQHHEEYDNYQFDDGDETEKPAVERLLAAARRERSANCCSNKCNHSPWPVRSVASVSSRRSNPAIFFLFWKVFSSERRKKKIYQSDIINRASNDIGEKEAENVGEARDAGTGTFCAFTCVIRHRRNWLHFQT